MALVGLGTGATLTFSGLTMNLLSIDLSGITRPSVKTSHLGTSTWDTFLPGDLTDPGTITVEVQLDPTLHDDLPLNSDPATATITIPAIGAVTGGVFSASAFIVDSSFKFPLEEVMTGTISLKLTSTLTRTAAA